MRLAAGLLVCLTWTATAYAQAPGEATVVVAAPSVGYRAVLANRWSVGSTSAP